MPLVSKTFSDIITFTRASTATYFNSAGTLTSAATNAPRLDYNPSTLAAQGLLIEEQRVNLLTYSENFDNAAWAPVSITVSANVLASPTGNVDADLIIDTSAPTEHYLDQGCATFTNQAYTQTVYAKAGTAPSFRMMVVAVGSSSTTSQITFTQTAGVFTASTIVGLITSATATAVGNGWYRCAVTYTLNGTVTLHQMRLYPYLSGIYVGTGLGTYFYGAQLEAGAFATSYIPTTTTALTRAADVASVNTLSPWYNASEGTLFAEGTLVGGVASTFPHQTALVGSNANNDSISVQWSASAGLMRFGARAGGATQADLSGGSAKSANSSYKVAGRYAANNVQAAFDGTLGVLDTAVTVPTIAALSLGGAAGFQPSANTWLRRVTYFPRSLSDAELQTLTT